MLNLAAVLAESTDGTSEETATTKSAATSNDAQTLSLAERLNSKRANARQLLLLARELTRESKHRRVTNTNPAPEHIHDRYVLDSLTRQLQLLLEEIAALEKDLAKKNSANSAQKPEKPSHGEDKFAQFVDDYDYAKTDQPSAVKRFFWPLEGKILSSPGTSVRRGGARWPGIFIDSTPGATVHAISSGKIVYAGEMKQLGLLVILDHEDGHLSLYGKNAELLVESGQHIEKNQPIAVIDSDTSGQSGDFYFEIRRDGKSIDPRNVCSTRVDISSQDDGH